MQLANIRFADRLQKSLGSFVIIDKHIFIHVREEFLKIITHRGDGLTSRTECRLRLSIEKSKHLLLLTFAYLLTISVHLSYPLQVLALLLLIESLDVGDKGIGSGLCFLFLLLGSVIGFRGILTATTGTAFTSTTSTKVFICGSIYSLQIITDLILSTSKLIFDASEDIISRTSLTDIAKRTEKALVCDRQILVFHVLMYRTITKSVFINLPYLRRTSTLFFRS